MKHIIALSVLLLASLISLHAAEVPATQHPNILHINADDHRADGLGALGNALLKTPNLDALVATGFTFTHCYTMAATCSPDPRRRT